MVNMQVSRWLFTRFVLAGLMMSGAIIVALTARADEIEVVTFPAAETPLKLAIASTICTLPGMPPAQWGALTQNASEAHVLIDAFDLHTLYDIEGAYLHSAPHITVEASNAHPRLVTRTPGGQAETIAVASKGAWLDGIYASLPSHAYRPTDSEGWSIIADMSETANGALVAVKVNAVDEGLASMDYIALLHDDGQLQQVRSSIRIPVGQQQALVLPDQKQTFLVAIKVDRVDDSKTCAAPTER